MPFTHIPVRRGKLPTRNTCQARECMRARFPETKKTPNRKHPRAETATAKTSVRPLPYSDHRLYQFIAPRYDDALTWSGLVLHLRIAPGTGKGLRVQYRATVTPDDRQQRFAKRPIVRLPAPCGYEMIIIRGTPARPQSVELSAHLSLALTCPLTPAIWSDRPLAFLELGEAKLGSC